MPDSFVYGVNSLIDVLQFIVNDTTGSFNSQLVKGTTRVGVKMCSLMVIVVQVFI